MVKQTGHSIFAHSRSFRPPRLLPLYKIFYLDYRQEKPLKYSILSYILLLATCHFLLVSAVHAESPNRIVSLAPNLTEILFAMGLDDRIVGVTDFCDYPEAAKRKSRVGGMYNPSLEAIAALRPDMVAMTTDGNLKEFEERLHSFNIRTYVFKAKRLFELSDEIKKFGATLGVTDRANTLAQHLEKAFNRYREFGRGNKGKKVLFIVWPEPLTVAGPGTAIDDAISLLGCENIASRAKTSYPKYSVEEIIRQAPDVIFIGKGHVDVKAASEKTMDKLSGVPAVKHNAVYYIGDSIYRLGPRIIKGIDEMAACLK